MMVRREFFAACAALALPVASAAAPKPPREFRRYVRALDRWVKIDPDEIAVGDEVWVFDPPEGSGENRVILISRVDHPERTVYSEYEIDPKTNKWVQSCRS